jgi:prepilin-type N-terminal cleavage/methylation domain-containing protein
MPTVRTKRSIRLGGSRHAGFSLVEVLLVVMVVLIIAAIAIPNLLHGKMRANEAAAVASMQTIHTAEVMYFNAYPEIGYASSLAPLGTNGTDCEKPTSKNACLIMDDVLTSGLKSGYVFEIVGDGNKPTAAYTASASPASSVSGRCAMAANQSGDMHFFVPGATVNLGTRSVGGSTGCDL